MPNFRKRDPRKEMMDGETNPEILSQNYKEIEKVNTFLGGYGTLIKGVRQYVDQSKTFILLDVGCGAGDNISALLRWSNRKGIVLKIIGLDYSIKACQMARERFKGNEFVEIVCKDYRDFNPSIKPEIIYTSLFNHHLTDEENVAFLNWSQLNCHKALVINDLHRDPVAYYSIKWIAVLTNTSIYFKNDAPLSVLRAFQLEDWRRYEKETGLKLRVKWNWAFRWLVIQEK